MNKRIDLAEVEETLLAKTIEVYAGLYVASDKPLDEAFSKAVARAFFLGRPAAIQTVREHVPFPEKAEIVLGVDAERKTLGMTVSYSAMNARPALLLVIAIAGMGIFFAGLAALVLVLHQS